jgi:hypothetical protein
MTRVVFSSHYREGRGRYVAELHVNGKHVGRVERGYSEGRRGSEYVALVDGIHVAEARTLADLREQVVEWAEVEEAAS